MDSPGLVNVRRSKNISYHLFVAGRVLLAFTLLVQTQRCVAAVQGEDRRSSVFRTQAGQLVQEYRTQLEELAKWCEKQGRSDLAKATREWLPANDASRIYVGILPEQADVLQVTAAAGTVDAQWQEQFFKLREQFAGEAFGLARKAVRAGFPTLAYELLMAAARENPDHRTIREMLGFQRYRDRWYTPYEVARLRKGFVWDDNFGWIPRKYLDAYKQGKRLYRGRWISKEEDAQLHSTIQNPWIIDTEHFIVYTNHSLEAGAQLAKQLELFYQVWRRLFIAYYADYDDLLALFEGRVRLLSGDGRKYSVVYFRDKQDYVKTLIAEVPQIEITSGYYSARHRKAFFFYVPQQDWSNVYHEVAHQLFHESRPVSPRAGLRYNFWIIEGIAMYMESLRREGNFYVLGGYDTPRFRAAAYRMFGDRYYIPLRQFVALGMREFQQREDIAKLYSEAGGLTYFLIHYDGGRYRDALVEYLKAVYEGRDQLVSLVKLTGCSFEELDRQYEHFMRAALKAENSRGN